MDAVCKTPRVHRAELLEHVHVPRLERITYRLSDGTDQLGAKSQLLPSLMQCIKAYDPQEDPYIEMLRQSPDGQLEMEEVLMTGGTFCTEQLTRFLQQSECIYEELGGWATDLFIQASVDQLRRSVENDTSIATLESAEKVYLARLLLHMPMVDYTVNEPHISPKLATLLTLLERMDCAEFSGLIFVKRRGTVSALTRLLSMHPTTKDRFRCASFVGLSGYNNRNNSLGDLLRRDMQRDTLSEFRTGRKNLIVATDVLEEGLDVSSCSLVICFDKPSNLKSFVQRRGRARHQESTYAIMQSEEDSSLDLRTWQELERAMVKAYQDDEGLRRQAWELETVDEDVEEKLFVPSTGACLSAADATQHLNHFCAVLPTDEFVDNCPMFSFEEDINGLIRGTVTLPNSVHPAVRLAQGKAWWRTERAARKDTAFQAYKALYQYGLVNDNLLPLARKPELRLTEETDIPSIVECSEQYDPYVELAHAWASPQLHQTVFTISNCDNGAVNDDLSMSIILPMCTPMPEPIPLYWENGDNLVATFSAPEPIESIAVNTVDNMRKITAIYLQAPTSRARAPEQDFIPLFVPNIPHELLADWISRFDGTEMALDVYARDATTPPLGIIRDSSKYSEPRLFRRWLLREDNEPCLEIECQSIPRRRNLLQLRKLQTPVDDGEAGPGPAKIYVVPAAGCTCAKLPASKAMFGLLASAILNRFEAISVAHRLNETILKAVGICNLSHVLTAITTPIAQASMHYQLYEFFGDSVLKFTVTCQLFFEKPNWHEGYLSESRDKVIQNKRLARAALDTGLDSFILTKRFTPRKWDAPMISKKTTVPPGKRQLSSKVLADVVEALIGAAYMDGGMRKAQACLHRFLPEVNIFTNEMSSLIAPTERGVSKLADSHQLAPLLGYKFNDASLLTEALTHPSCEHDTSTQSYQRIEYLGDAVLDMVVVSALAGDPNKISQGHMTMIKHAVVNANLLAFLCMDLAVSDTTTDVAEDSRGGLEIVPRLDEIHLWRFLRFNGPSIKSALEACIERYQFLRDEIRHALNHADHYPWELFARLRAYKFISDIVESTLGAMFIDSIGDLEPCNAFAERIGLLPYVRRVISEGVDVQHPRNAAQELVKSLGTLAFRTKRVEQKGAMATYRSSAVLNEEEIASVEGCASAEEAEVKVSHMVIRKIRAEQGASA